MLSNLIMAAPFRRCTDTGVQTGKLWEVGQSKIFPGCAAPIQEQAYWVIRETAGQFPRHGDCRETR